MILGGNVVKLMMLGCDFMYSKELQVALKTIKLASEKILSIYYNGFDVSIKEDQSVVTNADIASEKIIKESLNENFKEYAILSEESGDDKSRLSNDYCWIVDPLDGTKDYVNKTNNFAINIALAYKKEIVLGVISVPCRNTIYYAIKGQGAYKIENDVVCKISVSKREENLRMLTSQFFFNSANDYKDNPLIESMTAIGSSYKAGLIAEGKAEFCVKFDAHTKEWDTAPSEIIIKEAGAYAIQEDAGKYITSIEGDYNNVVGLPVDELKKYIN